QLLKIEVTGVRMSRSIGIAAEISPNPRPILEVDNHPARLVGAEVGVERGLLFAQQRAAADYIALNQAQDEGPRCGAGDTNQDRIRDNGAPVRLLVRQEFAVQEDWPEQHDRVEKRKADDVDQRLRRRDGATLKEAVELQRHESRQEQRNDRPELRWRERD